MQVTISFEKPAHMKSGGLAQKAEEVRSAGRHGDDILIHVNEDELNWIKQNFGPGSINPKTGLPQFNIWDVLLPAAANVFLPGVGSAVGSGIGTAFGLGADSVIAPMLGSALVGGGINALVGGNPLTGAIAGGLSQPLLQSLGAGQSTGILSGLNLMGNSAASTAASAPTAAGIPGAAAEAAKTAASNAQQAETSSSLLKAAPLLLAASALGGAGDQQEQAAPPKDKGSKQGLEPVEFTREQTNPKIDYTTYGYGPEQVFFKDNQLPTMPPKKEETQKAAMGRYVKGGGTGTSDSIPAVLSDGEYVIDAQTVSMLGDGSSDAGAKKLDAMRENIRKQKGSALAKGKFAPNAKAPLSYVKGA